VQVRGTTRRGVALVVALVAAAWLLPHVGAATAEPTTPVGRAGPRGVIGHDGRWFLDADGRVVLFHGVNLVEKFPATDPPTPAEAGFDADDAAFLRDQGFNVVRLGVVFSAVMPQPGVIDQDYVDSIAATVRVLSDAEIYVQLDMHQDGFGPLVHGNGFPAWATLTDGLPNPVVGFPAYYVQNPALQRAFDNFWLNADGPDGVPLQTHYATALAAVAAEVADEERVLGYDTMNEPWPGTDWTSCVLGCPDIEQARLAPFAERMTAAIRAVDDDAFVFTEPFVLFNFGQSDTSLSGFGAPASGLSFHVYALDPAGDEQAIDRAIAASAAGDAIIATEFGATNDPATLHRLTGALDTRLVPWIFWAYNENVIIDLEEPPSPENVRAPVVAALARPYPTATNGLPVASTYDPDTRVLEYRYLAERPGGSPAPDGLTTVLAMPPTAYPDGYTVEVTGAAVVSSPGAADLVLCNEPAAAEVVVRVVPGADPDPPAPVACRGAEPPTSTSSTTSTSAPTTAAPSTTAPSTTAPSPTSVPVAVAPRAVPVPVQPTFTG
jgi:endoglycosylceramidase